MGIAIAFFIGFVAGLRSMTAPAAVAIERRSWVLSTIFILVAAVELVFDKLPRTPSRLQAPPLAARCISGAACAFFLAGGIGSAALGMLGALAGSYGGAAFRARFPGLPAALVEDAVAVGLALCLVGLSQRGLPQNM
jgi:uncharacterized membrane protein